jgi:hypothetical protein
MEAFLWLAKTSGNRFDTKLRGLQPGPERLGASNRTQKQPLGANNQHPLVGASTFSNPDCNKKIDNIFKKVYTKSLYEFSKCSVY